jgi:hypothetical protein
VRTKEERSYYSWHDKQFLLSIDKKEGQVDRPVQRLYPFFTLPKALWGLGGLNLVRNSMLFPWPEPPLMKRVLLVTRLRLRPLMPMKQVFERPTASIILYIKFKPTGGTKPN